MFQIAFLRRSAAVTFLKKIMLVCSMFPDLAFISTFEHSKTSSTEFIRKFLLKYSEKLFTILKNEITEKVVKY